MFMRILEEFQHESTAKLYCPAYVAGDKAFYNNFAVKSTQSLTTVLNNEVTFAVCDNETGDWACVKGHFESDEIAYAVAFAIINEVIDPDKLLSKATGLPGTWPLQ